MSLPAGVTKVDAYRNLATGTWSILAVDGPQPLRGKLVGHPTSMALTDVVFWVRPNGRAATRERCRKKVHAGVRGTLAAPPRSWDAKLIVEVGYNPYLFDTFVLLGNGAPLERAAWVRFPEAKPGKIGPLLVGLYPEDAGLVAKRAIAVRASRVARMDYCRLSPAERKRLVAAGREVPVSNPAPALRDLVLERGWNG